MATTTAAQPGGAGRLHRSLRTRAMARAGRSALLLVFLGATRLLPAAPFVPQRDDQVLERLPLAANPELRELRSLRVRLTADPRNAELASEIARRYISLGRTESDPRYNGYAEGVLTPWADEFDPPPEILLLRATLRQNRHEFEPALADLSRLLARRPRHAGAWLTRAVILAVRGDYRGAERACLALLPLAERLLSLTCLGSVRSLIGQAEQSYAMLREALPADAALPVRLWTLTALAEIAVRLGRDREADRMFGRALDAEPRDAYLLGAYADFLLDQGRPQAVVGLLETHTRVDGLLLRLALAEQRLGSPNFLAHRDELAARFGASRLRGESLHQGEEARFALHLLENPPAALELARANFVVQREPRDARILLEAALAVGDRNAAQPVLDMLRTTGLEDRRLRDLAARIAALQ